MSVYGRVLALMMLAAPIGAIAGDCVETGCLGESCCEEGACGLLGGPGLLDGFGSCLVSDDKLLGIFAHSDPCFNDFISPMTNPVFFEDPRTLTEARFIFLDHQLPNALGGDHVQVWAMQARLALTENLSIIATKDGFIVSDSPLLNDGFADVAAGLKYNIYKDVENQVIASVGATYEIPIGTTRSLQGNGDGEFHLFASAGAELWEGAHWVTGSGFRLPANRAVENQMWYWSNHIDQQLGQSGIYLFHETNWYHYISSAGAFGAPIGGGDLFNLGSVGMAGENMVTGAYGVKYKPADNMEIGVAYEIPYSSRKDLLEDRINVNFIVRF